MLNIGAFRESHTKNQNINITFGLPIVVIKALANE